NAKRQAFALEQRPLLDVQFDPYVIVAGGQTHSGQWPGEARSGADLSQRLLFGAALRAFEHVRAFWVKRARDQAAADTADAKACRFLGGQQHEFDRTPRAHATALEGANSFKSAENTDGAVVHSGVRDGIDVRAGRDRRKIGLGANPAEEGVADGVFADGEALSFGKRFQPRTRV